MSKKKKYIRLLLIGFGFFFQVYAGSRRASKKKLMKKGATVTNDTALLSHIVGLSNEPLRSRIDQIGRAHV